MSSSTDMCTNAVQLLKQHRYLLVECIQRARHLFVLQRVFKAIAAIWGVHALLVSISNRQYVL